MKPAMKPIILSAISTVLGLTRLWGCVEKQDESQRVAEVAMQAANWLTRPSNLSSSTAWATARTRAATWLARRAIP